MAEEIVSMAEEIVDATVTVEKHVLEETPALNIAPPVCEHIADIDHLRASIGSTRDSRKSDSVKKVVPNYLRASTGSCHDLCKFGKKHAVEEKPWRQKPKQKVNASSSVDCVLIKVAGQQKKEKIGSTSLDAKSSDSPKNASSSPKTRLLKYNRPSFKRAPSVEPPEVIKKVISSSSRKMEVQERRTTWGGGKISKTREKVDPDSDKSPQARKASLAGDKLSTTEEKADSQTSKSPPRGTNSLTGDDKQSATEEHADSLSSKSPPSGTTSLAGDELSATEGKADSQTSKSPPRETTSLAGDELSATVEKAGSLSNKSPARRATSLAGDELSTSEEKADLQSNKSPPRGTTSLAGDKLSTIKEQTHLQSNKSPAKRRPTEEKAGSQSDKSTAPRRSSLARDKLSTSEQKAGLQSDKSPPRRASLARVKLSTTKEKTDLQANKSAAPRRSTLAGEKTDSQSRKCSPLRRASADGTKTAEKGDQHSIESSLRKKALLGGGKVPKTEDKADQQSDKPSTSRPKTTQAKPNSDDTLGKGEGKSNNKTERKISISRSIKKALAPLAGSTTKLRLVRTVSQRSGSLKLASKTEKVPEKTLHVIKVETGSSAKSSPLEKDARVKDKYKRTPRNKVVYSEEKHRSPVKLLFRSGKVIELLTPDSTNTPRRLKFKRARAHMAEGSNGESSKQGFYYKAGTSADMAGAEASTKRVALKRHAVQGNKEVRQLFNNVIEETASKLVVSRKSKVKALVGAFETVISLQEVKQKPSSSQPPKLSTEQ